MISNTGAAPEELAAAAPAIRPMRWLVTIAALAVVSLIGAIALKAMQPGDAAKRRRATEDAAAGRWDEVYAGLSGLGSLTPEDHLHRATAAYSLKREAEAVAELDEVPATGPIGARRSLLLGRIELAKHRARPMEAALREAVSLDPTLAPARRLLVYLYGLQERRRELMGQFATLVEQGPLTVDLVLHWCLSRGPIGDPVETLADLEAFVAADPDDRASRVALAEVKRRLGKLDDAISTLDPLPSTDADALAIRAQAEFDRGGNAAAEAILKDGPEDHAAISRLRGRRALARRDGAASIQHLRRADAADPDNVETLFVLAQALRLAGEAKEADRVSNRAAAHNALRAALANFSNAREVKASSFRKLAALCEAVDQRSEAAAWYRLAITVDPLDADAQKAIFRLKRTSR